MENNKSKEYFAQDEAGNTLFLLNKDHEIQKTYGYNAFGIILKETGSDGKLSNRLTYTMGTYKKFSKDWSDWLPNY